LLDLLKKQQLFENNIYSDFMHVLGCKLTSKHIIKLKNEKLNVSYDRDLTEILRVANKNIFFNFKEKHKIRCNILNYLDRENYKTRNLHAQQPMPTLSPEDRIKILRQYEALNKRIAEEYLKRTDGVLFKESLPNLNEQWKPVRIRVEDVQYFINNLLGIIRKDNKKYLAMQLRQKGNDFLWYYKKS
jgi:hypothetical protein